MSAAVPSAVVSPCVRICVLNDTKICVGCGRALDEIARWSQMSDAERREVCDRAALRRAALDESRARSE